MAEISTQTCRRCGHYQRAKDAELAPQYGKCSLRQDESWYSPGHPACADFQKLTASQRRNAEMTVWILLGISAIFPIGLLVAGVGSTSKTILLTGWATDLYYPLGLGVAGIGYALWRWYRSR